ncbi:MAG: DUF4974 domain-containing protein [Prevotella sp.]|nr:DUF4974 domain-containing protein [Prevotella sp.]
MEKTSENIRQLLDMLDNPEAYTEQEIQDIINQDEYTRETYRFMVEAKRSSRQHLSNKPVDVDTAWQKFNQKVQSSQHHFSWIKIATILTFGRVFPRSEEQMQASLFSRIAASFIGILLVSGITFAAIQIVRNTHQHMSKTEKVINTPKPAKITPATMPTTDTIAIPQPIIYDNIPLEKMLSEIAVHYNTKVTFVNDEARQLRFRFVWNPQKGIDQVVNDLNQFERLTVTLNDNQITVK